MRKYCSRCSYPESTCLCEYINPVSCPLSLIILQHRNESTHAKNTARLVKLVIPETRIVVGKSAEDFEKLVPDIIADQCAVVYPTDDSTALDAMTHQSDSYPLKQLIFIDGSWRQAYALWQANTWLHNLPQFHLNNAPVSQYNIRHVRIDNSLSTLEAVSHTVNTICGTDTAPLMQLQTVFQQKWRSPRLHRRN